MESISNQYKTQELCKKAVERTLYVLYIVPDGYKTKKMCEIAALEIPETLKYCPGMYKTQKMCNRAVEKIHESCLMSLAGIRPKKYIKKLL